VVRLRASRAVMLGGRGGRERKRESKQEQGTKEDVTERESRTVAGGRERKSKQEQETEEDVTERESRMVGGRKVKQKQERKRT